MLLWEKAADKLTAVGEKFESEGRVLERVGNTLTQYVSRNIVKIGKDAAQSAIEFETAMTGVQKTVNATKERIDELGLSIREMALSTPTSATDIAS